MIGRLRTWLAGGRTGPEMRRNPRALCSKTAPVEVQIMGQGFLEMLRVRDISIGGISVIVPHEFTGYDLATPVDLLVKLPGDKPFAARGLIRHAVARRFGIQFTELSDTHRRRIATYVEQRLAEGQEA